MDSSRGPSHSCSGCTVSRSPAWAPSSVCGRSVAACWVLSSGAGFVLGAPVCAALLLVHDLRWFAPLILATYFLYTWYNGPLAAVILDVVPPAVQASVLGAFVLFSHLAGDALAPPQIGYLSDRTGNLRTAMLLLPAVGLLGGLVILIALRTVARDMRRVTALDIHVSG